MKDFEHLLIYQILEVKTTHIIISWEIPDFMAIQSSSAIGTPGNAMEVKRHLQYVLTLGRQGQRLNGQFIIE